MVPAACFLLRLIFLTMKIKLVDPHGIAPQARRDERFIYAFWHNQQLLATYYFRNFDIRVLVSRSKDGDYISKALNHFGFGTVRSSTSQGKVNALRGLAKALKQGYHTAITPDGPRGPLYQAQPGAVFLASLSGHRIAPFGCAVNRVWRLSRSWDRFEIPKPFSKAVIVYSEPIEIPRKVTDEENESLRLKVENSMKQCRNEAKRRAGC